MLIRKTQQPSDYPSNSIHDSYNTGVTDTYSCNYINGIVESGNNSNGNWIKFTDGTMICYKNIIGNSLISQWNSIIYYQDISLGDWAEEFININNVIISNNTNQFWVSSSNATKISAGYARIVRPDANNSKYSINIIAIGTWK